jgi:SepF-like predicted cell division protein (DUF552 family)
MSLFSGKEDYVELEAGEDKKSKIPVEIEKINEYADSDRIQRKAREGTIMLVRVKELREKNIGELKRCVERVKRTVEAAGGEIVAVGDDWVIVTPGGAKIVR